jgi:hypothetical protein
MKKVCIEEKNREKIEAIIAEKEGKARVRTIGYQEIYNLCKETEKHLGIPKKHMHGVKISGDPNAQCFPSAYKGIPESSHFEAEYSHGKWYLTRVYRYTCRQTVSRIDIKLTEDAKTALIASKSKL